MVGKPRQWVPEARGYSVSAVPIKITEPCSHRHRSPAGSFGESALPLVFAEGAYGLFGVLARLPLLELELCFSSKHFLKLSIVRSKQPVLA